MTIRLVNGGVILRSIGSKVKVTGNENVKIVFRSSSSKVDRFASNQYYKKAMLSQGNRAMPL